MDVDDELRRLFAESGDRLDVPVRADVEQVIVAGARRVRRRRRTTATASGAVAAVAAIVGGIVLAGGAPDAMPPAVSSSATSTTTSWSVSVTASAPAAPSANPTSATGTRRETTTQEKPEPPVSGLSVVPPPKLDYEIVGPTGVRALHLGQSFEDAKATGMLKFGDELVYPPCTAYRVLLDGREIAFTYISLPESGNQVELISTSELQTPEGVGAGWTAQQVATVYPDFDTSAAKTNRNGSVAVPGNPTAAYQFWFEADGRMSGFNLRRVGQPCD